MARNDFNTDMDRYRSGSFDRAYDRNFDRGGKNSQTSLDRESDYDRDVSLRGSSYDRDYERDFGESSRDYGWDQKFDRAQRNRSSDWNSSDMRQNDFGTRSSRNDNFRETRWGAERGEHFGKGPKGWKRSDERIREEACEALYRDHRIDASDIELTVKDGTLTLSGTVDSRDTKRAAERCVENISGVDDVHNQLRISGRSGQEQPKSSLS